jgi:hypothetical protein
MIQKTEYKGWKALKLETDEAELVLPTDIGPRVISCALKGAENLFGGLPEQMGGKGEKTFMVRGGHRIFHSPEDPKRTYQPDNSPVTVKLLGDSGVELGAKVESATGIGKMMRVEAINATSFRITHRLTNHGLWPVSLAPWALTIMRPDGYGVFPYAPKLSHDESLLPNMAIVPWAYTDFTHPSWQFRPSYLGADVTKAKDQQKVGFTNFPGWMAYWTKDGTFVKYYKTFPAAIYPDLGCRFETYTCPWMIELESLGPLAELAPNGGFVEHVEYWGLIKGLRKPDTEKAYLEKFRPVIQNWLDHTHI